MYLAQPSSFPGGTSVLKEIRDLDRSTRSILRVRPRRAALLLLSRAGGRTKVKAAAPAHRPRPMPRTSPVLSLSDVSLVLDGKRVLSHVDWEVMPGQNWVVIGPNGAGKTSLLSIINGYRWPSSGEVSVLGRRFGESDLRELRRETGLVSSYLDSMIGAEEEVVE